MTTLLDQIIDGSSDDSVKTPNLLRKVQVAATRIGAPGVVEWVKQELQGYSSDARLPEYRVRATIVAGQFTGPYGSEIKANLAFHPDFEGDFTVKLHQPIDTLHRFAERGDSIYSPWHPIRVKAYEDAETFGMVGHSLFTAANTIAAEDLSGVIDTVRSKAMEFALELQASFPDAGSVDGPSIATDTAVAPIVFNTTNNIYGHGTNIATGSDISQKSVVKGNLEEFQRQVKSLGLEEADASEFAKIVNEEQAVDKPRAKAFLDKVRAGSIAVAAGVPSNVVAGSLIELGKMFLGMD